MSLILENLKKENITLPQASKPVANYVSYVLENNLIYVSGQICLEAGELKYSGKIGKDLDAENGYQAARLCAINLIAQLNDACNGDLEKVKKCVQLSIYVNSSDDFYQQPHVANGASDLIANIFQEKGKHSRVAVSCNSLPLNSAVEVGGIFAI